MIKIAITDDHPVVLSGITQILSREQEFEITGIWRSGEELMAAIPHHTPDILLLDIQMPGMSGIELAEVVSQQYKQTHIIALTSIETLSLAKRMMRFCKGYMLKDTEETHLVAAIKAVYAGEEVLDSKIQQQLMSDLFNTRKAAPKVSITRREKEILDLVMKGLTTSEIAEKLFLSARTVENHRNNLLHKFEVKNVANLVKKLTDMGMV